MSLKVRPVQIQQDFAALTKSDRRVVQVKKLDRDEQLVFGEVYSPGFPDSQGDHMTALEIKKMAYSFMRKGLVDFIDLNHSQQKSSCYVVESFIARPEDTLYIPDSWVLGVHIPDEDTWALVKSGELNGFSFDGYGQREASPIEMELPNELTGLTTENADHTHAFVVKFDPEGNFLGGWTMPHSVDGHVHSIVRGTITEVVKDHAHRFSFVEGALAHAS